MLRFIRYRQAPEPYKPEFTFVDAQGVERTAAYYSFESGLDYKIGEKVNIGYDPEDFSSVRITSWSANLTVPIFLFIIGGFLVWLGIVSKKQNDKLTQLQEIIDSNQFFRTTAWVQLVRAKQEQLPSRLFFLDQALINAIPNK